MRKILLLDFDHTLYPSTLPTLKAVDDRITLYIQTFLGFNPTEADAARIDFCARYGTTLTGLEKHHGVDREHYCDFIHAIDAEHLPPPDPALANWLSRIPHPMYIFTNARIDWALRGLDAMGLDELLPEGIAKAKVAADASIAAAGIGHGDAAPGPGSSASAREPRTQTSRKLSGIFDIDFMDWQGKPHPSAYVKVDAYLRDKHGPDLWIHFADDRQDNLESARAQGWSTLWVKPHTVTLPQDPGFTRVVDSLVELDPESLA